MDQSKESSFTEFVLLMALLSAMTALAIDAVLPAMGVMASGLEFHDAADTQLIISMLFAGMALGQVVYGPISDSFGRKKIIYAGLLIYIAGSLFSLLAQSAEVMLIGRFLQGLGAASPRIVSVALIRDRFEGREMAQVMSFVMGVFILVPALAPAIGHVITSYSIHYTKLYEAIVDMAPRYIIDTNRDSKMQELLSFSPHCIIIGKARVLGTEERSYNFV